jgi:hypothetical protein
MKAVSHQTARLSYGRHATPEDGVCVMELASMLAGEPFTDHPRSVCPVIAAFLRTYNDTVSDRRRQDLYRFAAAAVGTRASRPAARRRASACLRAASEWTPPGEWLWNHAKSAVATRAARQLARRPDGHARVLRLLDELVGEQPTVERLLKRAPGTAGEWAPQP